VSDSENKPTKEEIEKLNEQIQQNEISTVDSIKRDVTASIKKEMEDEKRLSDLVKANEELAEKFKKQEEDAIKQREEFRVELENMKNMKQGQSTNNNPFNNQNQEPDSNSNSSSTPNLNDESVVSDIEEESREAFAKQYGLEAAFGLK